jgi:hypothetical protein
MGETAFEGILKEKCNDTRHKNRWGAFQPEEQLICRHRDTEQHDTFGKN